MTIWLFLHIASMFGAVSIFVGQGLLSAGIAGTGDVRAIRRSIAAEERFQPLGGALLVLGIIFGVITALTSKLDLTAPWLLVAYGLVVLVFVTGISYHAPRGRKLKELANSSPEDQPSEALRVLINAPSARLVMVLDSLIWLGLIYVMVAKPFS